MNNSTISDQRPDNFTSSWRTGTASAAISEIVRSSVVAIVVMLCLSLLRQCQAQEIETPPKGPAHLNAVLDDWSRREAAIPSLRIRWTREERLLAAPMEPDDAVEGGGAIPQVVELTTACELVVDGDRFRYFRNGDRWIGKAHRLGVAEEARAWDGEIYYSYYRDPTEKYPRGIIEAGPPVFDIFMHDVHSLAPKLAFRPLNSAFRTMLDPERLRLAERDEFVDGCQCAVLELIQPAHGRGKPPRIRYELWIDRARASLPLRLVAYRSEVPMSDLTISYRHDDKVGWVPTGWSFRRFGHIPRRPPWTTLAVVKEFEANPSIAEEPFHFDYPPGTMVGDKRAGTSPAFHVIRLDGTRRDVARDESSADYDRLIQPGS